MFCKFCQKDFDPSDTSHWQIKASGYRECKVKNKEIRKQSQEKKNIEKYGTPHPKKDPKFNKAIVEKRNRTMMERYGVANPMQSPELAERQRRSTKNNYGAPYPAQNKEIIEKIKKTNLERYGVTCTLLNDNVQAKSQKTCNEKFGANYPLQSKEFRSRCRRTQINNQIKLTDGSLLSEYCIAKGIPLASGYRIFSAIGEKAFLEYSTNYKSHTTWLESAYIALMKPELNLELYNKSPEGVSEPIRPDFKISDKIYVNVDGLYWHCNRHSHHGRDDYHKRLREIMEMAGLRLLQFRQNEIIWKPNIVKSIVMNLLGKSEKIDARKCQVLPVNPQDSKAFFLANHLMGNRNARAAGLFHKGQLVACMSIRMANKEMEIARFANLAGYHVRGGFSKLLKYWENTVKPEKVVSFCDLRYATGASYVHNGFELIGISLGWEWTDGHSVFNRLACRANMDDRKLPEAEYAKELGWFKIFDAGQARYVKLLI